MPAIDCMKPKMAELHPVAVAANWYGRISAEDVYYN